MVSVVIHIIEWTWTNLVHSFTKALASASPRLERTIKANRALAYLKTDQYDAALRDAESVLRGTVPGQLRDKITQCTIFRTAQALSKLERIQQCCRTYEKLLQVDRSRHYAVAQKNLSCAKKKLSNAENAD